ncbi:MAG: caspase family protein, partial [Mesorhizobium sp.]
GQKALDRLGPEDGDPNSVFTRIFRPALATPGMPVVEIAKRTQVEVSALAATVTHRQEPAYYDQIVGQFYMQPPQPKLYGLVVGIDDYGGRYSLKGAVNDSDKIAATLHGAGAEKVIQITNQDVRLSYIDYVWNDMVEDASPGDTLFFTFSGTGYVEPRDGATSDNDDRRTVLLLSGTKGIEDYSAAAREQGGEMSGLDLIEPGRKLTDEIFTGWMEKAARKNLNVIVLIDGCHAGGLLDREFANVSFFGAVAEDGMAQERSFDGTHFGVGSLVFAQAIAGAADLNGDGYLTQRELFAFGRQNMFNMTNGRQDPQFFPALDKSSAELVLLQVKPDTGENPLTDYWKLGSTTR